MLQNLNALPADPILGLSDAYRADQNPHKLDLGVGVYKTAEGHTPIFAAVKRAEASFIAQEETKAYLPPAGHAAANQFITELIFSASSPVLADKRVATVQTPGGCGALRVAAELIKRANSEATIWVSQPTWANHIPLLGSAGIQLKEYTYYDFANHRIDFAAMQQSLSSAGPGDLVLLHASCHNPCGADLNAEQWKIITEMAQRQGFVPFIDSAYQGFGQGIDEDMAGLRYMAAHLPEIVVAYSCSKNFGLYRERVGAVSILAESSQKAVAAHSHLLNVARGIYSMPPSHGSAIVATIYNDAQLRQQWLDELNAMRIRINDLRHRTTKAFADKGLPEFGFIAQQQGMFSFLGITPEQVKRLREEFSIYMVDSSRISIAGLPESRIEEFVDAVAKVL
jgi:aspartate aminotransferase